MSLKMNENLYKELQNKARLSKIETNNNLQTGSHFTFYKDNLIEIKYNNKIYVYPQYGVKNEAALILDFLKESLDTDVIKDVFVYNDVLIVIGKNYIHTAFLNQLEENLTDLEGNNEYIYQNNSIMCSEEMEYRPYSLEEEFLAYKDSSDTIVVVNLKENNKEIKKCNFDYIIEDFSLTNKEILAISFYNHPYYIYLYNIESMLNVQKVKLNENINSYDYDIMYQITRLYKHKGNLYFTTRTGNIYTMRIMNNGFLELKVYNFYPMGSNIDYIKSENDYLIFIGRNNNILFYNFKHKRKEFLTVNHLVKSMAVSNFISVISLFDNIDEDYKSRIIESGVIPEDVELNEIQILVMYNPPNIEIIDEKLEYRFDDKEDPLVYINLNIQLKQNKINNFDDDNYRVKFNLINSLNENIVEESDVKLFNRPGIQTNMYIKIGRKSEFVDNNYLLKLLENGDFKYNFTLDNLTKNITFYNKFYPNINKDLYDVLTEFKLESNNLPSKNYFDGFEEELKLKDIFHEVEEEKVINLLSNLVNENYFEKNTNLKIDSEDMYLDYPNYNPKNYIDLSNSYPNNQIESNVINSDVYFNGYKLFKFDTLQKDNFDGSVSLYVNHNSLRKFINENEYHKIIKNKNSLDNDFIISNKSRSLYETEKLMFSHKVSNQFENQTSLLPTKGILLPNSRVKNFKIQNIRVYVKINSNSEEENNKYYHRLNPRNYNLWIDKEYEMLRIAIFGLQIPEGSTIMVMDNGLTNNVILYDKLNYIKHDIDSLPIVEVGPNGELLTELDRRTEDVEVIVDGLTLVPNVDFFVMNTPQDPDIPSLVAFRNVIPNNSKVEITLLNSNSSNSYYFSEPAIGTENVFVLPDDNRVFTYYYDENDKKLYNFEIFSNNLKIPNDLITIENSKAISIDLPKEKLVNVMIRFNFSHNEVLQQILNDYKYKNIDVNENRYHDYSVKYKNKFDLLTKNKQAKTIGNLIVLQYINSGKNILDCNNDNLDIDVNLNTDIIENTYIKKNINLDMNRTNLIKNIDKVSEQINELIDSNINNENLLLHSNNPSWYIENDRNLLVNSENIELKPNMPGTGSSIKVNDNVWETRTSDNKTFSVYYWLQNNVSYVANELKEKLKNDVTYIFSLDVKPNKDLDIVFGTSNTLLKNPAYKNLSIKKDKWQKISYSFEWLGKDNDKLSLILRNNDKNEDIKLLYKNIKLEKFDNQNLEFSYAPEDMKPSQYKYSKIDDYNQSFEQKENIKDINIQSLDNLKLKFNIDESLLERNNIYTLSFYARNKSKNKTYFVNENLDIDFEIKDDEFKPYVDYIFIDEEMDIDEEISKSYFIQNEENKDFKLDLFGFKLEKGLKRTKYIPNIKDLQELDLVSNTFNINYESNNNLLNYNKDYELYFDRDIGNISGLNMIKNSDVILNYKKIEKEERYTFNLKEELLPNTYYNLSFNLSLINGKLKSGYPSIYLIMYVDYEDENVSRDYFSLKYDLNNKKDFNGIISDKLKTKNSKIKRGTNVNLIIPNVSFDYLEAKNFQLEKNNGPTEWGLSLEELKEKYKSDINKDIIYNNFLSSKNLLTYFDLNEKTNVNYQMVENTKEKFQLTNTDIWKHNTVVYSTPPYYFTSRSLLSNGNSSDITFKPGEARTFSIYFKVEQKGEGSDNINATWYNTKTKERINGFIITLDDYNGGWQRAEATYKNETEEDQEFSLLFYGTNKPENTTYFTAWQLEDGEKATEYDKPLNVKQYERIQEILKIKKENNIEKEIYLNDLDYSSLDNNSYYTLSMDVKIDELNDITTKNLYAGYEIKEGEIFSSINFYYIPLDKINETFKAYFIFYIKDFNDIEKFILRSGYSREQSASNKMKFNKFKLEKGKIATEYSENINQQVEEFLIDPEI